MKKIAILLAAAVIASFLTLHGINADDIPSVVYVDDDYNEATQGWNVTHFSSIMDAIKSVAENGTVYIFDGIYYEKVEINKSVSLIGKNKPILNGSITIRANGTVIKNIEIEGGGNGILLNASSCIIYSCSIHDKDYGLSIGGDGNTITKCNFINNGYGIEAGGSGNKIFLNNFIGNTINACDYGSNIWHNGSIQKGNYWDDYSGSDGNGDGIGDIPYILPCGSGGDEYPLINEIDLFIPSVNITVSGVMGNNGWYVSNVTVTINATDDSGIAYVNYTIDNISYSSNNALFSFNLTEGKHLLECFAVDTNGNAGRISSIFINIDTTVPTITYELNPPLPDGENGWYVSNVEISLYASDATSGIEELNFRIDEGGWQDYDGFFSMNIEGEHILYFRAVDEAGNEVIINTTIKYDATPPSVSIIQPNDGFVKREYEIIWNASDGVDENLDGNISIYYSPDNGSTWFEVATGLNNTGSYMWNTYGYQDSDEAIVKILAKDDAGNVGMAVSNIFTLDNTPPTIIIKQPMEGKAYGTDYMEIEWEAYDSIDDNLDGTIGIYYYDGAWHEIATNYSNTGRYTLNIKDWDDGTYKIKITATDDAGNVGMAVSGNFTIDKQPPSVYISRPLDGYVYINLFGKEVLPPVPLLFLPYDAVVIGKITVEVTASDAHSGVQRVEIVTEGSSYVIYDPPYKWEWNPSFGVHSLTATAYDNAGNSRSYTMEKILCINI